MFPPRHGGSSSFPELMSAPDESPSSLGNGDLTAAIGRAAASNHAEAHVIGRKDNLHGVVQFFRFCGNVFRSATLGRDGKFMRLLGSEDVRREVAGIGRRAAESEERAAGSAGRACAGSAGGGVGCSLRIRGRVPGRCTEGEEAGCSFLLGDGTTGGERPVVLRSGPPSSACRASAATNVVQWKWIECRARCSH